MFNEMTFIWKEPFANFTFLLKNSEHKSCLKCSQNDMRQAIQWKTEQIINMIGLEIFSLYVLKTYLSEQHFKTRLMHSQFRFCANLTCKIVHR